MIQSHGQTSSSDTSANIEQIEQKVRAQMVLKGSADWFLYVTAISLINTILYLFDVHLAFSSVYGAV